MTRKVPKGAIALICAALAALAIIAIIAIPAYATTMLIPGIVTTQSSANGTTDDGWAWRANEEGTAVTLTGYTGKSLTPSVPAQVAGLPVTGAIVNKGAGPPSPRSTSVQRRARLRS